MNKRCNLQDKARIVTAFISTSCLLPNRIEHTTISEHLSRLEREVHARGQAGPPEQERRQKATQRVGNPERTIRNIAVANDVLKTSAVLFSGF